MVVSPAVLSKEKKAKKAATVSFSDAAAATSSTSSPVASTSKVPIASAADDAQMDDEEDDGVEGDGEWQTRQSVGHPSGSSAGKDKANTAEAEDGDEDDDAVMIDSNTLLPRVGSSSAQAAEGADQGLLKFPALSAKDMQGKVETQTRKVSVRDHLSTTMHLLRRSARTTVADLLSMLSSQSIFRSCAT